MDTSHLQALMIGLSHERERLAAAKKPREIELRQVWVNQLLKEIATEEKLLGMRSASSDIADLSDLSDEELMAELADFA